MAGIERSVQSLQAGLVIGQNPLSQKRESYSYALNGVKSEPMLNSSQLENEPGMTDIFTLYHPFLLLGQIWLGLRQYVLFIKSLDTDPAPFNRIYYADFERFSFTVLYDNLDLSFQSTQQVYGTYKVNYLNQRIIYFIDGASEDRSLNIDLNPTSLPIGQLAINPQFSAAYIQAQSPNDSGGRVQAGAYEFALRYRFQDYNVSAIFGLSLPTYISIPPANVGQTDFGRFSGTISGTLTSKSITLQIVDLDASYAAVDIIVVQTINGVAIVSSIDNLTYSGATLNYTYTGIENVTPIPEGLTAVTVDAAQYYGAEVIAQKENRLILGNLKENQTVIRYQQYANNIVVGFTVQSKLVQTAQPMNTQQSSTQDTLYQYCSYDPSVTEYTLNPMRGEVYSLGVSFVLTSGIETAVFHIPGRPPVSSDMQSVADPVRGGNNPKWQVYDTYYTDGGGNQLLSYWESDQSYPAGFDYPTGPVRHHKIPRADAFPITYYNPTNNQVYANYVVLQFRNIQLPPEIKAQVKLIKFQMTPRDLDANRSIVAKGAFIRTAISGASFEYTGNPHQKSPQQNTRYVVAASPFSGIPTDTSPMTDAGSSRINQMNATYANVKLNMDWYGYNGNGVGMSNPSNMSLPSPNTAYALSGGTDESNKTFLFFHSPDTDAKADNNDIPALSAASIYLEARLQGTVNWFLSTGSSNSSPSIPARAANAFGYNYAPVASGSTNIASVDFKGQCIFNTSDNRSGKTNLYKVAGAAYVPYNSRLSESTLGNISMPYYGQLRESGTLLELDPASPVIDFTDFQESSMGFDKNLHQPLFATGSGGDNPGGFGMGSIDGPNGTPDPTAKFTGFPGTTTGSATPNTAVYYYGAISSVNDSQYGKVLGLQYRELGLVMDDLTTDAGGFLTNYNQAQGAVGDTFIDMYTIKRTSYFNYHQDAASASGALGQLYMAGISSFPVETTVNSAMRLTGASDGQSYFPKDVYGNAPDVWIDHNFYYDNYLKINDDYVKKYSKENFGPAQINQISPAAGLVSTSTLTYQTRIAYSQQSLSEDTVDSWRTFKVNDYRDLPKNRGPVTGLFTKYDQLFALTRDSLYDVYGSNQNLQTTTAQNIAIGTGTFFGLEPKEVMSIDGGFAGTSSKNSIVETPYGYLFVDKNKLKIILYNEKMEDITQQGVWSFMQENGMINLYNQIPDLRPASGLDNPVNNVGYTAVYDPANYRILITKNDYKLINFSSYKGPYTLGTTYGNSDIFLRAGVLTNIGNDLDFSDTSVWENKGFTLSYSPILNQWVSFHSYLPTNYLPSATGFMAKTGSSNIKLSDSNAYGQFFNPTPDPFIVEVVMNEKPLDTKVLDSLKLNLFSSLNKAATNLFFDSFYVSTEMQHSGNINLLPGVNLIKKEKDWSINKFTDQAATNHNIQLFSSDWADTKAVYPIDKVTNPAALSYTKPWYTLGRLRDKYFIVRFMSNNLQNNKFVLNFVSAIFRRSVR